MKKNKLALIAILLIAIPALVFANGSSEKASTATNEIKLVGWSTTPQEKEYVEARIALFEEQNPGTTVTWEILPNEYNETLQIQIASGKGPDVFYVDASWATPFIENKACVALDEYLDPAVFDAFYPATLAAFQKDGKTYGLPKDMNTLVLYYDANAFEKYDQEVPTNWDELLEVATFFAETEEYDAGLVLRTDFARFYPFVLQNGGRILDENGNPAWTEPACVEAFDYYFNDLIGSGAAKTTKDYNNENESVLTSGKVPMMLSGGWAVAFLNENGQNIDWKMAKLPVGDAEQSVLFTVAYMMGRNARNPELCASFIEFMTGDTSQKMVVDSGLAVPTRMSQADYYIEKNPTLSANPEQAANSTVYNLGIHTPKIAELLTAAGEKIRLQGMSAEQALEEAETEFYNYVESL